MTVRIVRDKKPASLSDVADGLARAEDALEELVDRGETWAEGPLENTRDLITRLTIRVHVQRLAERHA